MPDDARVVEMYHNKALDEHDGRGTYSVKKSDLEKFDGCAVKAIGKRSAVIEHDARDAYAKYLDGVDFLLVSPPDPEISAHEDWFDTRRRVDGWYIRKSDDAVRVNVLGTYTDFFSRRTYSPCEGAIMYRDEAERAVREGYATYEPVADVVMVEPCVVPVGAMVEYPAYAGKHLRLPESVADSLIDAGMAVSSVDWRMLNVGDMIARCR